MNHMTENSEHKIINNLYGPAITDTVTMRRKRVLLIEDDRATRNHIRKILEPHCEYTDASSAGSGISKYIGFQPDIVFLDIKLPDNNGHDILKWIMRNDPGAYVVMFSAANDHENVARSFNNRAKAFISKPCDIKQMMYHINLCPNPH